jgi:hypothetical protein
MEYSDKVKRMDWVKGGQVIDLDPKDDISA